MTQKEAGMGDAGRRVTASPSIEDWRSKGSASPHSERRHEGRKRSGRDDRDPSFQSHEDKLKAMEGDWKKQAAPPRKHEKVERRGQQNREREVRQPSHRERDDRVERDDRRERDVRQSTHQRETHFHDRDDYVPRHRDREPRERHDSNSSGGGWGGGGESRRGKGGPPKETVMESGDPHTCYLVNKGAAALNSVLSKDFQVCPRQDAKTRGAENLPVLKVQASYLIEYVVSQLMEESGKDVGCHIYGGEARAIVAAEYNVEDQKSRPTDLDLRFKIGEISFESCRAVVESFLLGRLIDVSGTVKRDQSIIRQCYFQKQVVVGSDFSLLSIGDPETGRNLDLEFTSSKCETRCFFDAANAFVIPLPDPDRQGWKHCQTPMNKTRGAMQQEGMYLTALSQSSTWKDAVDFIRKGELSIDQPEQVFNGLPLYAHALSDKQLTPGTRDLEHDYGAKFALAFLEQAEQTCKSSQDPLRFIKSFLRSHYPSRPINALACLSQLLAVLRAHAVLEEITTERQAIADKLADHLAQLCREALQNAHDPKPGEPKDAVEKVMQVVRFAAYPFTAKGSYYRRDETVVMKKNTTLRLRRQLLNKVDKIDAVVGETSSAKNLWEEVCKKAAQALTRHIQDFDESRRADVEAVCEALSGLNQEEISGDNVSDKDSQSTDDESLDADRQSAVASSKSNLSLPGCEMSSGSSTSPSQDDETSSVSSHETENKLDDTASSGMSRKSPQVTVQVDVDVSPAPASPAPAPAGTSVSIDSPRTPGSASSRTPTSERRKTPRPGFAQPYRHPGRRDQTPRGGSNTPTSAPNTPQSESKP